jgi:PAS domain S-box-containing protein
VHKDEPTAPFNPLLFGTFSQVLDASPDAIVLCSDDGLIVYVNIQTEKWFGYTRSELLGKELEILIPERFRKSHRHLRTVYSEKVSKPRTMGSGLALYALRKDGSEFQVDFSIASIKIEGFVFSMAAVRDVTVRKEIEADRDKAMLDREEVLGLIAHDLKNPLGAILLNTQMLARHASVKTGDPYISANLVKIERSAKRMNSLIEEILIFKKLGSPDFTVNKSLNFSSRLVESAFEVMEPIAERKGIELTKNFPSEDQSVLCDKDRVFQILSNLIGNAIKFTETTGSVAVNVSNEGRVAIFSVTDSGNGISEADLPRVFDRFWQTKKTAAQGTGLGLAISKGIVEAHGGRIWAESVVGKGSKFSFTLSES